MRGAVTGVRLLAAFFIFGFVMCALTLLMLSLPGSVLEPLWRLNPVARTAFRSMGPWAFVLMTAAGAACLASAIGLAVRAQWGRRLAVSVLAVNLIADCANALIRHDARMLIGLPIGGAMIWFLCSRRVRALFERRPTAIVSS